MNRDESMFWIKQVRCERRILSALGLCVPYHLCCIYVVHESVRDQIAVRTPPSYERLETSQGFRLEQESIFIYKSRQFIDKRDTVPWVVAYTERVVRFVRVCASLFFAVYDAFVLWYVTPDIIKFAP